MCFERILQNVCDVKKDNVNVIIIGMLYNILYKEFFIQYRVSSKILFYKKNMIDKVEFLYGILVVVN